MNVTTLSTKEKEEKIKTILDFHRKNKNIPAVFKMGGILARLSDITNNKSKDITGTIFSIPNNIQIDVEKDGVGVRETIFWYGGDNIFTSYKKHLDRDGNFKVPSLAKQIYGNGNMLQVKPNNVENERKLEYLLYVSMFFQNGLFMQYDDGSYKQPVGKVSTQEKKTLFNLLDKLSSTTDGYNYLLSVKENGIFAKNKDVINAILSQPKDAKKDFIIFIENSIDTNFIETKDALLPFKDIKELYLKAKAKNIIGYNKPSKAWQIKGEDGKFFEETTIIVSEEKDQDVLDVLLMNGIKQNEKIKNNLLLLLKQ